MGYNRFYLDFTGFYWVLLGFTEFCCRLGGMNGDDAVLFVLVEDQVKIRFNLIKR